MRRNEAKRKLLRLFVPLVFCLVGAFSVQSRAEDAFVVEEKAVIGGEESAEPAPPVQRPEVSKEPIEKKTAPPKKIKADKITEQETERIEESNPVSVSKNAVSENTVSQNSVSLPFQIPVRKQVSKPEKKAVNKDEIKFREQILPEEPEPEEVQKQSVPGWIFVLGVVFFLCGCIRVVRRIGN
ncbi:MAG: hypothetical protein J6B19_00260 [Lachnospiraceae bacterium]|nr:hypothetical protein [Lachnospiraceae bacterium]